MFKKTLLSLAVVGVMFAAVSPVFAHGGSSKPNNPYYVNPEANNCMGQLARMHAKDMKWGTHGLPHSFAMSTHGGFGLGNDTGDSVHDTMHAFQGYCGMHAEE